MSKLGDTVEEEIWALEEVYFANLYKADHEGVLALIDSQFLGWPDSEPHSIDKEGAARYMKQMFSKPASCALRIEREGIRILADMAFTEYTIHVTLNRGAGVKIKRSSRITHTWVKRDSGWKVLGGMSRDQ